LLWVPGGRPRWVRLCRVQKQRATMLGLLGDDFDGFLVLQ
jgi:hypothetical protein